MVGRKNIAIFGAGNIGQFIWDEFQSHHCVYVDPKDGEDRYRELLLDRHYDFGFVCVPTDLKEGKCDTSIVESVVALSNCDYYIVKSAVPPGTCDTLVIRHYKRIVYSPEYYGLTQHSFRKLDFVILGGIPKDRSTVAELYGTVKKGSFRCVFTNRKTAELAKYMENCFLAMKVTFCNEFASVAEDLGINYAELRELFIMDERLGASHTFVYKEEPYYNSHCLNKDIPAFISFAKQAPLMTAVNEINLKRKNENNKRN